LLRSNALWKPCRVEVELGESPRRVPHLLIEGCAIGCYANRREGRIYSYIRGEFFTFKESRTCDRRCVREGDLGRNIFGSGFDCDVYMHRGAGAYEAGEETALLESLEGSARSRAQTAVPAVAGLYGKPSAVNNVETLCNVPVIVSRAPTGIRRWPGQERRAEAVLRQRPREESQACSRRPGRDRCGS